MLAAPRPGTTKQQLHIDLTSYADRAANPKDGMSWTDDVAKATSALTHHPLRARSARLAHASVSAPRVHRNVEHNPTVHAQRKNLLLSLCGSVARDAAEAV